jgi:hypothetical protein
MAFSLVYGLVFHPMTLLVDDYEMIVSYIFILFDLFSIPLVLLL